MLNSSARARDWLMDLVSLSGVHAPTTPAPDGLLISCPPLVSCGEAAPFREEGGRRIEPFSQY